MIKQEVRFFNNELEDDFANNTNINTVKIDKNYKYIHKNPLWNIASFIIYRIIFLIPAFIYSKIKFRLKIVGREKIKKYIKESKKGFFVYHNHTQEILDTFLPTFIGFPKKAYIIANADNVSIKGLKIANKMMGAIPIPEDKESTKKYLEAIQYYIEKGNLISIYPEAHVWPYYTKIRNYKSVSFKYPVKYNVPAFSCTTTYQKYKKDKFKTIVYIDGPFYANDKLPKKSAQEKLRNDVYNSMKEKAKNSNIDVIKYIKKEDSLI